MPNLTALDGLFENLFQLADQSRIQLEYLQNDFFDLFSGLSVFGPRGFSRRQLTMKI
jgi:hypothetical protein